MPLTSHPGVDRRPVCGVCGGRDCRTHPVTQFWFPDNLPKAADVERHRADKAKSDVEREVPVTGDAGRPTAEGYTGKRPGRRRARTGRRSRWPEEDRQAPRGENR